MKTKAILSLALAAVLTTSTLLSACSTATPAASGDISADPTASSSTATDDIFDLSGNLPILKPGATMPKVTILFREFADVKTPIDESVQVRRFAEETGLTFEWIKVPTEGYNEKLTLMMQTNDLPDLIWTPMAADKVLQAMGQDILVPTNDLIDKYMPNLKSILDKNPEFRSIATAPDGNLYGFPYIVQMQGLILSPGPIMMNKVWLDKVNLPVPATVDEYYAALKAFKTAGDLNGNGVADEYAYAGSFSEPGGFGSSKTFNQFTGAFGCANSAWGDLRDNLGVVDGKVEHTAMNEAYKQTSKFFRKMQEEGLVDPDSFSAIKTWEDKLKQNIALIGSFGVWSPEATIVDPEVRKQYVTLPRLKGSNGNSGFALNATEVQEKCHLAITANSKYPEMLAKFIDYLYTPEVSVTSIWGAEGEGWMYHKDDKGMLRFNVDENNDLILPAGMESFWSLRSNSGPVEGGAVLNEYYGTVCEYAWDAVTLREGQVKSGSNEILAEYEIVPPTYLQPEVNSRASQLSTELNNIVNRYTMSWVMDGNIDATWDSYISEMKAAGVEEFVSIFQKVYDDVNS